MLAGGKIFQRAQSAPPSAYQTTETIVPKELEFFPRKLMLGEGLKLKPGASQRTTVSQEEFMQFWQHQTTLYERRGQR